MPASAKGGGWFAFAMVLLELLFVDGMNGFMPGAHKTVRRRSVYASVAWLMVLVS